MSYKHLPWIIKSPIGISAFTAFIFWLIFLSLSSSKMSVGIDWQNTPPQQHLPILDSWAHIQVVDNFPHTWPYRVFKSSPWTPINITITRNEGNLSAGYLFLTPRWRGPEPHLLKQTAPIIITSDNELVYAFNESYGTNNFGVQEYAGKPHLTFWDGYAGVGHGFGNLVLLDQYYRQSQVNLTADIRWRLGDGRVAPGLMDFHDHTVTPRGTLWTLAYNHTTADLTSIGGSKNGWMLDTIVYEIDIATNNVLFSWSVKDHIPIGASQLPLFSYTSDNTENRPWDHAHLNSVQEFGDYILVNGRHTFSVYLVDRMTGQIVWELNGAGKGGDFGPLPKDGQFRWQHHARAWNATEDSMILSIFDNHNMADQNGTVPSRGLLLELSLPPDGKTPPKVLRNIQSPHAFYADSQGSYDPYLPNGNQLICYGPVPVVQEFGPGSSTSQLPQGSSDGTTSTSTDTAELLWEGEFGVEERAQSYRAFKTEWHATPADWDPSLFVEKIDYLISQIPGTVMAAVHVSWNGATDIEAWNIYTIRNATDEKEETVEAVGKALKKGFETVFWLPVVPGGCVQVGALESDMEVRRSNVACLE